MTTPDLFAWSRPINPPAQRHSATSMAAAEKIRGKCGPLHNRLLDALRASSEGLTDDEMQAALDMNPSTQRPRRIELLSMGKIRDSGTTRPTRTGRAAAVWVAV
jgi:hypothetical protein